MNGSNLHSNLLKTLRQVAEDYQISTDITKAIAQQVREAYGQVSVAVQQIDRMLKAAEVDAVQVGPFLAQTNLWIPPSIPTLELLYKLKEVISYGTSAPDIVKDTFVQYFEENSWGVLGDIVSTWEMNPYFRKRMPIFHDALEAHIQGKYTLTVPVLLSQVEGVASSILNRPASDTTSLMKTSIENNVSDTWLRAVTKDILIGFVTSPAGYGGVKTDYFTPEKFPEWLETKGQLASNTLNRHAILHGIQIDYASKENSLRAFLLLDVFFWMKRDEWDKKLKYILRKT